MLCLCAPAAHTSTVTCAVASVMNIEAGLHTTHRLPSACHAKSVQDAFLIGSAQKHFRWTMVGPDSSYSPFEIHICWKVLSEDRIEPPIHTEYLRSGGATTLIFIVDGARAVSSFVMRSPMPWNIVVPPESTTFAYKSLRMSTSHFMMDWKVVSWIPLASPM